MERTNRIVCLDMIWYEFVELVGDEHEMLKCGLGYICLSGASVVRNKTDGWDCNV